MRVCSCLCQGRLTTTLCVLVSRSPGKHLCVFVSWSPDTHPRVLVSWSPDNHPCVLVSRSPDNHPTERDIEQQFEGNICRCTGYRSIFSASDLGVHRACLCVVWVNYIGLVSPKATSAAARSIFSLVPTLHIDLNHTPILT